MKNVKTALAGLALLCLVGSAVAQKKYAVLITGDYAASNPAPGVSLWNNQPWSKSTPAMEFWNDTFLMWKMLQEKGFAPEDIFVLFADGKDFTFTGQSSTYQPPFNVKVTDYPADMESVNKVFNGLRYGTNGLPKCTEDDFLFVWSFDHGGWTPGTDDVFLVLIDGFLWDYQLAALANPIEAYKKVYWMQQCHSGGFADDLAAQNTVFISASQANELAWRADDAPYIENEIINNRTYTHGEFNFHMISSVWWQSPTGSSMYGPFGFSDSDVNDDYLTSMSEAFNWLSTRATFQWETPAFSDLGNIATTTSLEYPTVLCTDVTANAILHGDIALTKNVHITSGNTVRLYKNSKLVILNGATMTIDQGASLIIDDNVEIIGTFQSKIFAQGNITIGKNVTISKKSDNIVGGSIEIDNPQANIALESVTFDNTDFKCTSNSITFNSCTLTNVDNISLHSGNVQITNSEFNASGIFAKVRSSGSAPYSTITLNSNTFTGPKAMAIELNGYEDFFIEGNTISRFSNGIQIFYCGNGNPKSQIIENNTISNCSQSGVMVYSATSIIRNNNIQNNYVGVKLMNSSNIDLSGNVGAVDIYDTQLIKDNTSHQIFISQNSFPWYMKFNAIIDDYNTVPLVKYERPGQPYIKVDVSDNFWGVDFNAASDLYIDNGKYGHLPIWQPLNPYYPTELELQYKAANDAFAAGNYAEAKAQYMDIIENNPETVYAEASMKELIRVEPSAKGNLSELKAYYQTNAVIAANENLSVLGDFLANLCDVHMENWADAIAWYEAKIMNPANEQERIFAEIDLGYTYFLMENSANKAAAAVTGMLRQHKYETVKAYNTNRDYLLSLLPGEAASENVKQELRTMESGALLQNYPNPFSQSTTIWYKTDRDAAVQLVVFDMTGKEVARVNEGNKTKGTHSVEFHNSNLSEGIYFYTLTLDGQRTDSKKMNVVR